MMSLQFLFIGTALFILLQGHWDWLQNRFIRLTACLTPVTDQSPLIQIAIRLLFEEKPLSIHVHIYRFSLYMICAALEGTAQEVYQSRFQLKKGI